MEKLSKKAKSSIWMLFGMPLLSAILVGSAHYWYFIAGGNRGGVLPETWFVWVGIAFFGLLSAASIVCSLMELRKLTGLGKKCQKSRWFRKAAYDYGFKLAKAEYVLESRKIKTKDGKYRVDFQNRIEKKAGEIADLLLDDSGKFKDSLNEFLMERSPNARVCDFEDIVDKYRRYLDECDKNKQKAFLLNGEGVTPDDFRRMYARSSAADFDGIYVLHNEDKDKAYVGQSVKVIGRVKQHLSGHGNGDVYADMKYGDTFSVHIYPLEDSGYENLDAYEKAIIALFHANENGYNKTKGNG